MNLIKNFFFGLFFLILSTNILKAENNVSYLDIDFIITNTLAGKKLLLSLKKEEESKVNKFKLNDENFKNKEVKILAKKKFNFRSRNK